MTKILALDVATTTGYAVLTQGDAQGEGTDIQIVEYGSKAVPKPIAEYGPYPWNYVYAARDLAKQLAELVARVQPDAIVIEETNLGRARGTQKLLEFLHNSLLTALDQFPGAGGLTPAVFYVSSSTWRKTLGIKFTAEDRLANKTLSRAKSKAKGQKKPLDKKALGIKGRIGWKHLSIRWVNQAYGLSLQMKDDDVADALALGTAFLQGAEADE